LTKCENDKKNKYSRASKFKSRKKCNRTAGQAGSNLAKSVTEVCSRLQPPDSSPLFYHPSARSFVILKESVTEKEGKLRRCPECNEAMTEKKGL